MPETVQARCRSGTALRFDFRACFDIHEARRVPIDAVLVVVLAHFSADNRRVANLNRLGLFTRATVGTDRLHLRTCLPAKTAIDRSNDRLGLLL